MILRNMRSADYDQAYALWLSCKGMGINAHDDSRVFVGVHVGHLNNFFFSFDNIGNGCYSEIFF